MVVAGRRSRLDHPLVITTPTNAVPAAVPSVVMEITCASCGCVVVAGLIIERCDDHPGCCCGELPLRRTADR